jgi:hypothetical protein
MKLKVFLDTTVLLKGFSAHRKNSPLPDYFSDLTVQRYTFEKCIFECYAAFRGVGGKKPDEGRGRWAQSNLTDEGDPASIGKLISQIHNGSSWHAFFWINQILEAGYDLEHYESRIEHFVRSADLEEVRAQAKALRELADERSKFERLCGEFCNFLKLTGVQELLYGQVFGFEARKSSNVNACTLDSFARDIAIPSEDFEIVYAALTLPADIFVTDDERLITCAMSLGLNNEIPGAIFCSGANYTEKLAAVRLFWGSA